MRYVAVLLVLAIGISACSEEPTASGNRESPKVDEPTNNYKVREGTNYGYVSGISEEDKAKGKAAGELILFHYLGKIDGLDTIEQVDENGALILKAQCANPCEFMKVIVDGSTQRMEYNPESLGGAVMQDAQRGMLEIATKKK